MRLYRKGSNRMINISFKMILRWQDAGRWFVEGITWLDLGDCQVLAFTEGVGVQTLVTSFKVIK